MNVGKCREDTTQVKTNLTVQMNRQTSLDDCGQVQTNINECRRRQKSKWIKKIFVEISGGFPRWMFFSLRRFLPQKLRRMKKFFYILVKRRFCPYIKEGYLWNKVAKQKKKKTKMSERSTFFCFRPTWKKFFNCLKWSGNEGKSLFNRPRNEKGRLEIGIQAFQFFIIGI